MLLDFAPTASRQDVKTILIDLGDHSYVSQCPNCRSTAVSAEIDVDFHFRCYECYARLVPIAGRPDTTQMGQMGKMGKIAQMR